MTEIHFYLQVLQHLNYVDDNKTVQLKGRVACEMGSHELLITELVFNNILTDRPVQEIVALLSCLVFQQRNCSAPGLISVNFKRQFCFQCLLNYSYEVSLVIELTRSVCLIAFAY